MRGSEVIIYWLFAKGKLLSLYTMSRVTKYSGFGVEQVRSTVYANCLNACDTPTWAAGLPAGTIFKSATPPLTGTPLYIM